MRLIVAVPALLSLLIIGFGYTVLSILFHYSGAATDRLINNTIAWTAAEKWTLVAMLGFFFLSIIAGLGLAFSILSPLRSISQALERAAHGSIEAPLPVANGGSEVDLIGRNFNSMMQYLNQIFQERNRFLTESVQAGLLVMDEDHHIIESNEVAGKILGIAPAKLEGLGFKQLSKILAQQQQNHGVQELVQAIDQSLASEGMVQAAQTVHAHDTSQRAFSFSCAPRHDAHGHRIGYLIYFRDISRNERMRLLLARTDQLAALGAFSMGLAHELRNPLGSIKGLAQLLEESQEENSTNLNFAGRIVSEVDRLDAFIRELLEFGQQSAALPAPCDLAELARQAVEAAVEGSDSVREKQLSIESYFHEAASVLVQKERIVRALTNIVLNAFDAAPEGGRIHIRTGIRNPGVMGEAFCDVENEGAPIPPDVMDRIFEPFFTTKAKGTGLGLAIASQIVIQNGGRLVAEPVDHGAKFVMAFPLTEIDAEGDE